MVVYRREKSLLLFVLMLFTAALYANSVAGNSLSGRVVSLDTKKDSVIDVKGSVDYPVYRRIDFGNRTRSFDFEGNLPAALAINVVNYEMHTLYENSGDYGNPNNQSDLFGDCGGRVYNKDRRTGDYKRDSLGNVISFLGINMRTQYGKTTNYAIYLDTAYLNRGSALIKPQYMLVVDPYIPKEEEYCDPVTGDFENLNGEYVIGRYMYNTTMYAKPVADSIKKADGSWIYADKYYNKDLGEGIKVSADSTVSGYLYTRKNFNKVQPVRDNKILEPNGEAYLHDALSERFAFSWAIHKGDSLYVLKGADLEPAYKGLANDPQELWLTLTREYGEEGMYIDFDKLRSENIVPGSEYKEAYYRYGDRNIYPEMRTYYDFKPSTALSPGKTIGLHAIIALDDNTHKDWVFAFRFVERGSDDFTIESETTERNTADGAMIAPGYGGWMKFENGVPVITRTDESDLMAHAVVFNVERLSNPVDNENIVEGNAASKIIVAGATGSIKILNAAGKNIVVRNVLGQTVVNTVVSSDNESISSPSGIVIVVVDNGRGIKTIVK